MKSGSGALAVVARLAYLFVCPFYFIAIAVVWNEGSGESMAVSLVKTAVGVAVVAVLWSLVSREFQHETRRFSLVSLLAITAIVAIYLTFATEYFTNHRGATDEDPGWIKALLTSIFFMFVTTICIVNFVDALFCFLTRMHRSWRRW
jgi:uncharacterized membrane-anchored protein